jgi:hypothetical protein
MRGDRHGGFQRPGDKRFEFGVKLGAPKNRRPDGSPNLFLIWVEYSAASEQLLYFAKSTDSGTTWSVSRQITFSGQVWYPPDARYSHSMCVEEPYVHVVYNWRASDSDDWEIIYLRSDDLGETWDAPRALTKNASSSLFPDVAARGNYVHVTYQDDWPGNNEIMYKRITNYGAGAVDQTRRLTFSSTSSRYPQIAVSSSGESVSIVYEDIYNFVRNIFYKHIYDSGAGSYETRQLTFGTEHNFHPDVATSGAADPQYVYIVYQANWPGNPEIMYKRLDNFGQLPFNTYTVRLSYSTVDSVAPAIDFDTSNNNVHICYYDTWPGNPDVMYRRLGDFGGDGFLGQRVSWEEGESWSATLTSAGAWAYIAWMDDTSGNSEIYVQYGN